jgi:hypothetical protein
LTFEEWYNEIEVYSARWERAHFEIFDGEPIIKLSGNLNRWLKAAYEVGYEAGKEEG